MPTRAELKTRLDFLQSLERGEVVSQLTLSQRVGASVGLVNALLKRAVVKGYVKVKAAPYKRFAYYLTPTGFAEKSQLVVAYLDHSLGFFRDARDQYRDLFLQAEARRCRRVLLIGAGELAEIALLAASETEVEIVGILDPRTNRDRVGGIKVLRELPDRATFDLAVLTDASAPQATYERLVNDLTPAMMLAPDLLHLSRPESGNPTGQAS